MKQEKQIYEKELSELLRELGCRDTGLSNSEAESRLVKYGANELHTGKQKSILRIFLGQFADRPGRSQKRRWRSVSAPGFVPL